MMHLTTQSDLENLISAQIEESLNLDYKASESISKSEGKKKEITKDVSALANAAGGQIVYGIREHQEPDKAHLPEAIDPINRKEFPKEWLEHIINNIRPRIDGMEITSIQLDSGSDDVAYVVTVPPSHTAHQATDFRYYKRFNFESTPMYDYEVRDVMARAVHPVICIECEIRIENRYIRSMLPIGPQKREERIPHPVIGVIARNEGSRLANFLNAWVCLPKGLLEAGSTHESDEEHPDHIPIPVTNRLKEVVVPGNDFRAPTYSDPMYRPILPSLTLELATLRLADDCAKIVKSDAIIYWKVYADNSEMRCGQIQMHDIRIINEYGTTPDTNS